MYFNFKKDFAYGTDVEFNAVDIYVPHPFTNWSLNPNYKFNGVKDHTLEGFRKTSDDNSLQDLLDNYKKSKKIYCMGGSTTYCTELYNYKKSWPYKLQNKLDPNKHLVINAGVGGWGTLQSLIRFIGWANIIKPEITIIYLSKNDLTPFYNGRENEKEVYPLYENVMLQFNKFQLKINLNKIRFKYLKNLKLISLLKTYYNQYYISKIGLNDLSAVYSENIFNHKNGLKRFNKDFLNATLLRYEIITNIISKWGGKLLFIPEIIDTQSAYFSKMQEINSLAKNFFSKNENFFYFDPKGIIDLNDSDFLDKMHFSNNGTNKFSDTIFNILNNLKLF